MDFVEAGLKTYMIVAGALVAVVGVFALRRSWRLLSEGERTSGTVVGWEERHDKMEDSYTYLPKVSYRGADGRMAEFTSWTGSGRRTYAIGDEVPIRLISGSPDKAEIARPGWMIGGPLLMIVMAVATMAIPFLKR